MATYRGFSLHEFRTKQTTKLLDQELIKLNLLTHIYTLKGDRLNMSTFGTRIPELVFEPMSHDVIDIIRMDLKEVCDYDPRVELISLDVVPLWDENVITASLQLKFVELNTIDTLALNIAFEE